MSPSTHYRSFRRQVYIESCLWRRQTFIWCCTHDHSWRGYPICIPGCRWLS